MNYTYTVSYRRPWWPFWRKIKNVANDQMQYDQRMGAVPGVRVIMQADDTRTELPANLVIRFGPERMIVIERNRQQEAAGNKGGGK